ncbi:hypothetical protein [Streptomyces canus]|uniref:hypothetical protein n=1 Tax=Streptomyces canus TaxID=58343 RepID=UPI00381BE31A
MTGAPFRRRYRDALTSRRPPVVYRPTSDSPLWRRYLAALFDVPRTPRPKPPAAPSRAPLARLPMALILAAVAASLLLGGTTVAVLHAGTERDLGNPPFSTPATAPGEPTEEPTGGSTDGPTGSSTDGPTGESTTSPLPPPTLSPSPTEELPRTGPSAFSLAVLAALAALGVTLLAVGAAGMLLTRFRP